MAYQCCSKGQFPQPAPGRGVCVGGQWEGCGIRRDEGSYLGKDSNPRTTDL